MHHLDKDAHRAQDLYLRKVALSKDLIGFLRLIDPNATKVQSAEMHHIMVKHLTNLKLKCINIAAPRGTAKSTYAAVALPLWHIFLEDYYRQAYKYPRRINLSTGLPEHCNVIISSKTKAQSIERLDAMKSILNESQEFKELFGDYSKDYCLWASKQKGEKYEWRQDLIRLHDDSIISGYGATGFHGRNWKNVRTTFVAADDYEDESNTKTPESMKANMAVIKGGVIPGLYPGFGRCAIISTPIRADSMAVSFHKAWGHGEIPGRFSVWFKHSNADYTQSWTIPESEVAVQEQRGNQVIEDRWGYWVTKPGLLFEDWIGREDLKNEKASVAKTPNISIGWYYRQHECQIVGDEERVFEEKWFDQTWDGEVVHASNGTFLKIYRRGDEYFDEPLMLHVGVTHGYDLAYSVENSSSFSTACSLATDVNENRYELGYVREKFFWGKLLDVLKRFQALYRPTISVMEANGPQKGTFEAARMAGLRVRKDNNIYENKISRIEMLQEPMLNGKFYFLEGSPASDEAYTFPRGRIDYLDAMEKANRVKRRGTRMKMLSDDEAQKKYSRVSVENNSVWAA